MMHAHRVIHLTKRRDALLTGFKSRSHDALKLVCALTAAQLPQAELKRHDQISKLMHFVSGR